MAARWDDKDAADIDDFTIDFAAELASEGIVGCTWSVTPAGMTIGATTFVGTLVTARLSGGATGTDYLVSATVSTSSGRILHRSRRLLVTDL